MKKGLALGLIVALSAQCFASTNLPSCDSGVTTPLNNSNIEKFARAAAVQTFTYNFKDLSKQLHALKTCYTHSGWESFQLAFNQTGNALITKNNKLFVSAEAEGNIKLLSSSTDAGEWRVVVPLKVTYENNTKSLTQTVNVNLLLSRDNNKLGIEQLTATLPAAMKKQALTNQEENLPKQVNESSAQTTAAAPEKTNQIVTTTTRKQSAATLSHDIQQSAQNRKNSLAHKRPVKRTNVATPTPALTNQVNTFVSKAQRPATLPLKMQRHAQNREETPGKHTPARSAKVTLPSPTDRSRVSATVNRVRTDNSTQ